MIQIIGLSQRNAGLYITSKVSFLEKIGRHSLDSMVCNFCSDLNILQWNRNQFKQKEDTSIVQER